MKAKHCIKTGEIFGDGSYDAISTGKQFAEGSKALKVVYESLLYTQLCTALFVLKPNSINQIALKAKASP